VVKDSHPSHPVATTAKFKNTQPQVEQSLLLWAMVVLLAVTAFISLDLATHTAFSFLAIPFGIAGSLWSYRRRHLTKHPLTYLVSALAIFLILTCLSSAFWGQIIEKAKNFLGSNQDLVLPLATSFLLVALQLARMWSLCYQRGLASSVVISIMLMVGTVLIGNNFGFLLVLALFMGLLVPTLMLFYRSTINLKPIGLSIVPRPQQLTERHVPWRHLTKIAAASVVLGCMLSLFAPHLRLPEVSWDFPGVEQIVKNLPIQTDSTLSNPNNSSSDGANQNNPEVGKAGNKTGQVSSGTGEPENDAGQGGIPEQQNAGSRTDTDRADDSRIIDERLARQAVQNILATADRPLKTKAERKAYIQKYLQEHIQSPDCGLNNASCFNSSLNSSEHDRLTGQDQTSLAHWNSIAQIPLQSYYLAQQQTPPPLLQQLTTP
jgi:TgpA N-terminal domain